MLLRFMNYELWTLIDIWAYIEENSKWYNYYVLLSLRSRREAFLSQNIRTCMCSFTLRSCLSRCPEQQDNSVIIWPSLWFTEKQHWPLTIDPRKHWQKSQNWEIPEGLCMDLGLVWTLICCKHNDPHPWCCNTEIILMDSSLRCNITMPKW